MLSFHKFLSVRAHIYRVSSWHIEVLLGTQKFRILTRIHNVGHIHNANFVQTQFSTSHPKKWHFLKKWKFTFLWKYSVCGFKFEISEYPIKLPYVSYSPYKYELKRIKTHEIRAKYFLSVIFPVHCSAQKIHLLKNTIYITRFYLITFIYFFQTQPESLNKKVKLTE